MMVAGKKHSIPGTEAEIHFLDVWKQFPGSPTPTLAGMNLRVPRHDIHVLLGFSGMGKSVTLKHILGLLLPDSGKVMIQDQNICDMRGSELRDFRKKFGMLFQGSALFDSLDVYENLAFPLREHRKDMSEEEVEHRIVDLLKMVRLEKAIFKMPSELSGGMRKRVGLARCIALQPEILLFDEPTTGLDPVTSNVIDDLIVETTRKLNATSLVISHDIVAALRMADSVSMLHEGKIIESSDPKTFRTSKLSVVKDFLKSAGVGET